MAPCLYCLNYSFKDVDVTRSVLSVSVVFVNFDDLNRQAVLMSQLFMYGQLHIQTMLEPRALFQEMGPIQNKVGQLWGQVHRLGSHLEHSSLAWW